MSLNVTGCRMNYHAMRSFSWKSTHAFENQPCRIDALKTNTNLIICLVDHGKVAND